MPHLLAWLLGDLHTVSTQENVKTELGQVGRSSLAAEEYPLTCTGIFAQWQISIVVLLTISEKHQHCFYTVKLLRFIYIPQELNQAQLPPTTVQFKAVECCAMQKEIRWTLVKCSAQKEPQQLSCHWNKGNLQIIPFLAFLSHSNSNEVELSWMENNHLLYVLSHV